MKLSSSAFSNGKSIPTKYAHPGVSGGKNISLPLAWSDPPPGTRSFAVSIIDPHPVAKNWVHWFAINIPANSTTLLEGASGKNMPKDSKELYNTYGTLGYGGPEPPKGSGSHPYVVTVYAIKVDTLGIPENTSLPAFQEALKGKILASATITGKYEQ